MAGTGQISVLVSKELQAVILGMKNLADRELAAALRKATRDAAQPIWQESVRGHAQTRMQVRALSDTAKVAVTNSNVLLRSASSGKVGNVPASVVARGVEHGANRDEFKPVRGKNGTYERRTKRQFQRPRRGGYVFYPAAGDSIPRLASLWVQTCLRGLHEAFEAGEK